MKKIIISAFFVTFALVTNAQNYGLALGARLGPYTGITGKYFLGDAAALEGIIDTRWSGTSITLLYEVHNKIPGADSQLEWYYGGGAHIGFWNGSRNNPWFNDEQQHTVVGLDAIIGIEYTFKQYPINISLDYKPVFNFAGYNGFVGDNGALSVRYAFK